MLSASTPAPFCDVPLHRLLQVRGVYNVRKAPAAVAAALKQRSPCSPAYAVFNLIGENSLQIRGKLNKQLARELAAGTHDSAFAALCELPSYPRADDIENLVATFPSWDSINWDAPAVASGLDVGLWQAWHARHYSSCSATTVSDACYFKLVRHFLRTGFDPPTAPGVDLRRAVAPVRAYVDLWRKEEKGCVQAFEKWIRQAENLMSPATAVEPSTWFPILPVVREKDRWLFRKFALHYKVRLCLDFKAGSMNSMLLDWNFRYLGMDDIALSVRRDDWLAVVDISRFYLRLPAGEKLREVQWFQDPSSYAANSHDNAGMAPRKRRFRQLLAVAFGLKSAPAWASVVSSELARILRSFGIRVAGVYLDDLLLCAPSRAELADALSKCCQICSALGLDLNDKTVGPCAPHEGIKYLGVVIRTDTCSYHVCPRYAEYACDKLSDCLRSKWASLKELESIAGICSWIAFAMIEGRPRRNVMYRAVARLSKEGAKRVRVRGELKRQLSWWLQKLHKVSKPSSFFYPTQPLTPVMCSDASGEDGWGVCAMGFHIVGRWPARWRQSAGVSARSMLYLELLPPVVAAIVLARLIRDKVWCAALDNAGAAFVLNKLSCGCPFALELLRRLADSLAANRAGFIAGHAHRAKNSHTDDLSHVMTSALWAQVLRSVPLSRPHKDEVHFVITELRTGDCWAATIGFTRPSGPSALSVEL